MKKTVVLALVLALLIALAAGVYLYMNMPAKEKDVYVPGQTSSDLLSAALDAGKIVTGDLTMHFDIDAAALTGNPSASAPVDAILSVLDNTHLRFGFGLLDRGFRLELGASLDSENGASSASVDGAANVTLDGLSVESDMIPGQRVSAQWETLLRLAGVDEGTVETFTSLRDTDPEELPGVLNERVNALAEKLSARFEPYSEILFTHLEALPKQVEEKVPAQGDYPAVAKKITATVTPKDLASLLTDLIDRAEADGLFASPETARQVAELRDSIDMLSTQDSAFYVQVGLNGEDLPLFVVVDLFDAEITETTRNSIRYICTPQGGTKKEPIRTYSILFDIYVMDEELFSMACAVSMDPNDPVLTSAFDVTATAQAFEDGVSFYSLDYTVNVSGERGEDGLPLAKSELHQTQLISDGYDDVRMIADSASITGLTADGGEKGEVTGSYAMMIGEDNSFTFPIESRFAIYPAAVESAENSGDTVPGSDGIAGNLWVSTSMPELGINAYEYNIELASKDYDLSATEALEEIALETADSLQMATLYQTLQTSAAQKAMSLLSVLPSSLMTMLLFM